MRAGRAPSWPVYHVGIRLLEGLELARDALMPPDLRALQLSYAFVETAIVYQVRPGPCSSAPRFQPPSGYRSTEISSHISPPTSNSHQHPNPPHSKTPTNPNTP